MGDESQERTYWQQLRDHYGQFELVLEQWQKEVGRGPGGRELAIARTNIETGWLWIMRADQVTGLAAETQVEVAEMPPE